MELRHRSTEERLQHLEDQVINLMAGRSEANAEIARFKAERDHCSEMLRAMARRSVSRKPLRNGILWSLRYVQRERNTMSLMLRAMARRLTEERRKRQNLIESIGDPGSRP